MPPKNKTNHLQRVFQRSANLIQHGEEADEVNRVHPAEASTNDLRRAVSNPRNASAHTLLNLQSLYGNHAVQRLLAVSKQKQYSADNVQRVTAGGRQRGKAITGVKKDRNSEEIILERLRNPQFRQIFWTYCIKEYSAENLEALLDIQDYKVSPNLPRARRLYNQYIASKSPKELNLSSAKKAETNTRFLDAVNQNTANPDIFDKTLEDLMVNILDTWARFEMTEAYEEWKVNHPHF